jgi:hypothetical protein
MKCYYSNGSILKWLFEEGPFHHEGVGGSVLTSGEGPYRKSDFEKILGWLDYSVFPLSVGKSFYAAEILIVGQEGWNEDDLIDLLDERRGRILRVYSQEMFLSYLLTEIDPLSSADNDWIISLGEGHSALEFLMNLGFDWPSTVVFGGGGSEIDDSDWPRIGLMKALGYKVGKTGIQDAKKRHELLTEIFMKENLPAVMSKDYLAEWGSPGSCPRLKKMVGSIATFCRSAKRDEKKDMSVAIEHWEEDFEWLKKEYYHGHCQFSWPSTRL